MLFFHNINLFLGYYEKSAAELLKTRMHSLANFGTFPFELMPFGLMCTQAPFQRMTNKDLNDTPFAPVYLDGMIIFSIDYSDHIAQTVTILKRIYSAVLRLKLSKYKLSWYRAHLLGHIVMKVGIGMYFDKIRAIEDTPSTEKKEKIRSFLGPTSYYKR